MQIPVSLDQKSTGREAEMQIWRIITRHRDIEQDY